MAAPPSIRSQQSASPFDVARLHAALDGDASAIQQLVEMATPVVQARVARALLRRPQSHGRDISQDVADLTQDVFLGLFVDDAKALRSWDPALGLSLANFIGLLAERRVASVMRVRRRAPWSETPSGDAIAQDASQTDASLDAQVLSRDTLQHLFDALAQSVSVRGLELFYMLYVRELSIEETCAQTGLNPGAVYQWRRRLGQAARAALIQLQAEPARTFPDRADRSLAAARVLQPALDDEER